MGCAFNPGPTESSSGAAGSGPPINFGGSFGTGGAHGGSSGTSSLDANCAAVNQGAVRLPPDILIVQDKSGSMKDSADGTCTSNCGTKSKWSQVTAALNQVVGMTDTSVNWGLKFFSDYSVTDTASLVNALNAILGRVASCKFDIGNAPNSMTSVNYIDVYGDTTKIPQDTTHANGWDYTNTAHTAIEVYGPQCDAITAGTIKTVTVTFRCIIG